MQTSRWVQIRPPLLLRGNHIVPSEIGPEEMPWSVAFLFPSAPRSDRSPPAWLQARQDQLPHVPATVPSLVWKLIPLSYEQKPPHPWGAFVRDLFTTMWHNWCPWQRRPGRPRKCSMSKETEESQECWVLALRISAPGGLGQGDDEFEVGLCYQYINR